MQRKVQLFTMIKKQSPLLLESLPSLEEAIITYDDEYEARKEFFKKGLHIIEIIYDKDG